MIVTTEKTDQSVPCQGPHSADDHGVISMDHLVILVSARIPCHYSTSKPFQVGNCGDIYSEIMPIIHSSSTHQSKYLLIISPESITMMVTKYWFSISIISHTFTSKEEISLLPTYFCINMDFMAFHFIMQVIFQSYYSFL